MSKHVIVYPSTTATWNPSNSSVHNPLLATKDTSMKLWVVPPSTKEVVRCPCIRPLSLRVLYLGTPERVVMVPPFTSLRVLSPPWVVPLSVSEVSSAVALAHEWSHPLNHCLPVSRYPHPPPHCLIPLQWICPFPMHLCLGSQGSL
jgi:hypothetical protein